MTGPALAIAVLASGRGSNLQALAEAIAAGTLAARIVGVFSDKPACGAMAVARAHSLHALAIRPRDCADRAAHDQALFDAVAGVRPDLVVCAGYMRILGADAVRRFQGRMINLHPSLLPRHPGLDTHARALAAGDSEHGASVHAVVPELDAGPVLAQARIPVLPGDDAEALALRLRPREHALLLASVGLLASGRVQLGATTIQLDGCPLAAPLQLNPQDRLNGA